jgi:hypothetical protein
MLLLLLLLVLLLVLLLLLLLLQVFLYDLELLGQHCKSLKYLSHWRCD